MNDKFHDSKRYVTSSTPVKTNKTDYGKQYIEALSNAGIVIKNEELVRDAAASFREDLGLSYNKRLNNELKEKWVRYYLHTC